jgi:hypothetical protein
VNLERETDEKLEIPLDTSEDPGAYSIEFAITTYTNKEDRPGTWVAGTWDGAAAPSSKGFTRVAVTPSFGSTWPIASGDDFALWSQLGAGAETVVERVGRVRVK